MPHACQSGRCGMMRNWTEAIWENIQRRGIFSAFFLAVNVWIVWLADHVGLRWLQVFQFFTWDEYPPVAHFWGHGSTTSRLLCGGWILYVRPAVSHGSLLYTFTILHHSTETALINLDCKDSSSLKLNANLIDWRGWELGTRARVHGYVKANLKSGSSSSIYVVN